MLSLSISSNLLVHSSNHDFSIGSSFFRGDLFEVVTFCDGLLSVVFCWELQSALFVDVGLVQYHTSSLSSVAAGATCMGPMVGCLLRNMVSVAHWRVTVSTSFGHIIGGPSNPSLVVAQWILTLGRGILQNDQYFIIHQDAKQCPCLEVVAWCSIDVWAWMVGVKFCSRCGLEVFNRRDCGGRFCLVWPCFLVNPCPCFGLLVVVVDVRSRVKSCLL
jgi:hypothetical protein